MGIRRNIFDCVGFPVHSRRPNAATVTLLPLLVGHVGRFSSCGNIRGAPAHIRRKP